MANNSSSVPIEPKPTKGRKRIHPNSLANLAIGRAVLAEKAKNGLLYNQNPDGYSLAAALKTRLRRSPELREQIIDSTIQGTLEREPTPFKELWDRVDGKLAQPISGSVELNHNIVFRIGKGYLESGDRDQDQT